MSIPIYQVDSFTDKPFAGNPAGVCLLPQKKDDNWMQSVAMEMNLAETAFLVKRKDGWDLRWFTPTAEVELCGHATLASAHILWENGILPTDAAVKFFTLSGILTAKRVGRHIQLDFPSTPPAAVEPVPQLNEALGVTPTYTGKNQFDYIVKVNSADIVKNCQPDMAKLKSSVPARGVIVTSRSHTSQYDFISRFFAPNVGIDEDPVTGSAHCCLAPYWAAKLGKEELTGYQASPRGGIVRVTLSGDRVLLSGAAVTVIKGQLTEGI